MYKKAEVLILQFIVSRNINWFGGTNAVGGRRGTVSQTGMGNEIGRVIVVGHRPKDKKRKQIRSKNPGKWGYH